MTPKNLTIHFNITKWSIILNEILNTIPDDFLIQWKSLWRNSLAADLTNSSSSSEKTRNLQFSVTSEIWIKIIDLYKIQIFRICSGLIEQFHEIF